MKHLLVLFFTLLTLSIFSQKDTTKTNIKKKHYVYYTWGYTRAWYSTSTIHFVDLSNKYHPVTGNNNYYDFTITKVNATDRSDFNKIRDIINITIPQFVSRLGFHINDKWDFEINYDHAKYVVDDGQRTHIKGQIFGQAVDKDTTLTPALLHFEHTDGANFWMFNAVRKFDLIKRGDLFRATWVVKPGAGFVFPRTDVTMFGERLNNNWHISGWIVGIESGIRLQFITHGFFEFVGKAVYADYTKCLLLGRGNGSANHHFFATQLTGTIGYKFTSKTKQ